MYDDVWGDDNDTFTDADPGTKYIYGYGATDGSFDWYEVDAALLDSNNVLIAANSGSGWGTHMEADEVASLDWNGSAEGSYQTQSNHYRSDDGGITTQFLGFISWFFDVGHVATRYYYVNTVDGYHQYSAWFCGNRCQKSSLFLTANFTASPYIQGQGWYVSVFGVTKCSIDYATRGSSFLLACYPPN